MNDKQKTMANLIMVIEELPKLAEKMPSIREDFDMERYGCYEELPKHLLHMCGTSGCLLGNIARLFPIKDCYFDKYGEFSYGNFCQIEFPYLSDNFDKWDFLFESRWAFYQLTFDQAMKRLEYFIKHDGELPNWDYQKEDFV